MRRARARGRWEVRGWWPDVAGREEREDGRVFDEIRGKLQMGPEGSEGREARAEGDCADDGARPEQLRDAHEGAQPGVGIGEASLRGPLDGEVSPSGGEVVCE